MWLLRTDTFELEYFAEERNLRYAILSHRWHQDEVQFQDIQKESRRKRLAGWSKILKTCQKAKSDGFNYVWIDTCLIDKASSAELSEAINSMYRWYQNAAVCYALLSDVHDKSWKDDLRKSVWFTRGWTLQELIAPQHVIFFSATWNAIGTRESLANRIQQITRIPLDLLQGESSLEDYSVAQRMSWAAHRETTRAEDRAYSLLGLFSVNMPMMYGEGERAFTRLQEEIIRRSTDHSIFAWKLGNEHPDHEDEQRYHGLLASSLERFSECGDIVSTAVDDMHESYQLTNAGLKISFLARVYAMHVYHASLNCTDPHRNSENERMGIFLGIPPSSLSTRVVGRRLYQGKDRSGFKQNLDDKSAVLLEFVVPLNPFPNQRPAYSHYGFRISDFVISDRSPRLDINEGVRVKAQYSTWNPETQVLTIPPSSSGITLVFVVTARFDPQVNFLVGRLTFDINFRPWLSIPEQSNMVDIFERGSISFKSESFLTTGDSRVYEKPVFDRFGRIRGSATAEFDLKASDIDASGQVISSKRSHVVKNSNTLLVDSDISETVEERLFLSFNKVNQVEGVSGYIWDVMVHLGYKDKLIQGGQPYYSKKLSLTHQS